MKVLSVKNIMQLKINRLSLVLGYEKIEFIFEIEYIDKNLCDCIRFVIIRVKMRESFSKRGQGDGQCPDMSGPSSKPLASVGSAYK